jgi:TolA-binding protein
MNMGETIDAAESFEEFVNLYPEDDYASDAAFPGR